VGYEHSTKIEEATEEAAEAIRDAAARAAVDRAHARAHTSALASIALVLAVAAALIVATGVLAVIGVGIGVLALLFAIGGLSATGRRYRFIAGRGEALVGLLLATAAIVVGILAITGVLPGFDTDTNVVEELSDQLPGWLN
jgi:membrane-bound lytic murein transglycosylase B